MAQMSPQKSSLTFLGMGQTQILRHVLNAQPDPKRGPQWCPSKVSVPTPGALRKPSASKQSRLPDDCGWFVGEMGRVYHPYLVGNIENMWLSGRFFPSIHCLVGWLESWGCLETLTTTPAVWCHSVFEKTTSFVITQGIHRGIQKNDEFHHFPVGTIWKNDLPKPMFFIFQVESHLPIPLFLGGKDRAPGTS